MSKHPSPPAVRDWRRFLPFAWVALAAIVAGVLLHQWQAQTHHVPNVPEGALQQLRALPLHTLDGEPYSLASATGKTTVINFWATWCQPCKEEMPEFARLQTEYARNVQFVGIGIDSVDNMQAFSKKTPVNYPLLSTSGASISLVRALGNKGGALPFTLVLNPEGAPIFVKVGRVMREELVAALTSPGSGTPIKP